MQEHPNSGTRPDRLVLDNSRRVTCTPALCADASNMEWSRGDAHAGGWHNRNMNRPRPGPRAASVLSRATRLRARSSTCRIRMPRITPRGCCGWPPGDAVRLFNGDGGEWNGPIADISQVRRLGAGRRTLAREVEAALRVVLAQAISSRERMELTLQKAVELGVAEIFSRSRPSAASSSLREERASRRVEHWQHIVIAACEQCGRNRVPNVLPIETLPTGSARWRGQPLKRGCMLSPGATLSLRELARAIRGAAAGRTGRRPGTRGAGDRARPAASRQCAWGRASCARKPRRWRPWRRCMRCGAISERRHARRCAGH